MKNFGIRSGLVGSIVKQFESGKINGTPSPVPKQSPASPNKGGALGGLSNFKSPNGAPPAPPLPPRNFAVLPSRARDAGAQFAGPALQVASHFMPPGPASMALHAAGAAATYMAGAPGAPGGGGDPMEQMMNMQNHYINQEAAMTQMQNEASVRVSLINQTRQLTSMLTSSINEGTKNIVKAATGG